MGQQRERVETTDLVRRNGKITLPVFFNFAYFPAAHCKTTWTEQILRGLRAETVTIGSSTTNHLKKK